MKLLNVTRENHADKKYGLAKSLSPLLTELDHRGIEHLYLCQADLGVKARDVQLRTRNLAARILARLSPDSDAMALSTAVLERFNMGRLAARVAARENVTHVHLHDPIMAWGYRIAARLIPGCKARWGVTEHGYGSYIRAITDEGYALSPRIIRWLQRHERNTLAAADWVINPTMLGQQQLMRDLSYFERPEHWSVIPHPAPQLPDYSRAQARQQLRLDEDTFTLVSVGRLIPLKGFHHIITAVSRIPGIQLIILGEGLQEPLQQQAQQLGCADRIRFTVTDDIALYLKAADLYISMSETESFGMANLEALLTGTPAICTAVGGVPEVMGGGAVMIPRDDANALQQQICTLMTAPQQRESLAQASMIRGQQWYNGQQVADLYLSAYSGQPVQETPVTLAADIPETPEPAWLTPVMDTHLSPCPLPEVMDADARRTLVLAPHPDDETFGCGGTLARLIEQGKEVRVCVITDGDASPSENSTVAAVREAETREAARILGITDLVFCKKADQGLWDDSALRQQIADEITHYQPDWILSAAPSDCHRDHVATGLACTKAWAETGYIGQLWFYEIWTPLPVSHIIKITDHFTVKNQAMNAYQLPLSHNHYIHHINGLNAYRALALGYNDGYAEGFTKVSPKHWRRQLCHLYDIRKNSDPTE